MRFGRITRGALNHVCRRLSVPPAEAYGVATFYALLATTPQPPAVAHVCDDIACRLLGAEDVCAGPRRSLGPGRPGGARRADRLAAVAVPRPLRARCRPRCSRPRAAAHGPGSGAGRCGRHRGSPRAAAAERQPAPEPIDDVRPSIPQLDEPELRLLRRVGRGRPHLDRRLPRAAAATRRSRRRSRIGAEAIDREATDAKLVGRGGAAFPTGRKWAAVAAQAAQPHYVVCNADESEPGTFKDRVLMEGDPFAVVEAMTIEGFATGAARGYLYIRGEYPLAEARIERRHRPGARRRPPRRRRRWARGFAFDIEVRRGAGAYICGEETALFESIEGKRGEPRNKPPFPVEVGLFGKPTAVNNVETLANVPLILSMRRRRLREARHRGLDRAQAVLRLRQRRAARRLRGPVRGVAARAARRSPAACRAAGRSRRSSSAARPACSSGRTRSTCR